MRRVWRILFWAVVVLSLLANAVTLGVVLRLGALRDVVNGGSAGMPREARAAVRAALAENRPRLGVLLAELGEARAAVVSAAAARPFDRAAVEAAQTRVREATARLQVEGQKLMLDALERTAR